MDNQVVYDQIEAYLRQEMPLAERTTFEQKLLLDKALEKQFKEQELEHKLMETLIEDDLRKELNQWQEEVDGEIIPITAHKKKGVKLFSRSFLAIAASVFLLMTAMLWLSPFMDSGLNEIVLNENRIEPTSKEIAIEETMDGSEINETTEERILPPRSPIGQKKTQQAPSPPEVNYIAMAEPFNETIDFSNQYRGVNDENKELNAALNYFNEQKFNLGIDKLNALLAANENNLNAVYNLGLAYYQQKKYKDAIAPLKTITEKPYLHSEKAQWFLCLSYFQNKNNTLAQQILEEIGEDPEHAYYSQANLLRNKFK